MWWRKYCDSPGGVCFSTRANSPVDRFDLYQGMPSGVPEQDNNVLGFIAPELLFLQGLKPECLRHFSARLKSWSDTKRFMRRRDARLGVEFQLLGGRAARPRSSLEGGFQQAWVLYLRAAQQLLDSQNLEAGIGAGIEGGFVL
jgi:hypothetical protein